MDMLNNICLKASRVYRTLNKPLIRSKVDADLDLYPGENADKPTVTVKIKDLPEIKLLDLILALCALKIFFSAVKAVIGLFK